MVLGIVILHDSVFPDRIQYFAEHPMIEGIPKGQWFGVARVRLASKSDDVAGWDKNSVETSLETNLSILNHGSPYICVSVTRVVVFDKAYLK